MLSILKPLIKTEFGTMEYEEEIVSSSGSSIGKLILPIILILLIVGIFIAIRIFLKKNENKTKRKTKMDAINLNFEKKKAEENDRIVKYATDYLNQFDFSDGDEERPQIVLRDLYGEEKKKKDEESELRRLLKKPDKLYGFFEDDAEDTIKKEALEEKVKALKKELDNGISDDVNDYFNKNANADNEEWFEEYTGDVENKSEKSEEPDEMVANDALNSDAVPVKEDSDFYDSSDEDDDFYSSDDEDDTPSQKITSGNGKIIDNGSFSEELPMSQKITSGNDTKNDNYSEDTASDDTEDNFFF